MSTVPDRFVRWERLSPLSGLLAVLLWVVGIAIIESGTDMPDEDQGARAIAAYFSDESGAILAGGFLFMLGSAFLLWFLGTLRARIESRERGGGGSVVFAAGIATAVMSIAFVAPQVGGAVAAEESDGRLEPAAAEALWNLGDGFFVGAIATVAVFYLAAGFAGLRTRAIPVWLAWASLALAVAAFVPWIGWAVFIWGLPLWVLVASVSLYFRADGPAPPAAPGSGPRTPGA